MKMIDCSILGVPCLALMDELRQVSYSIVLNGVYLAANEADPRP
jgi:hypothetical protein